MVIQFFINSNTVNITNYTIKDIPGSSGRLDVIARCILAAILNKNNFEKNVKIWVFLKRYGSFLFDPDSLNYHSFPKNEILLSEYFVDLIKNKNSQLNYKNNPLMPITYGDDNIFDKIRDFKKKNHEIYVLSENGKSFLMQLKNYSCQQNIIFIIGSQSGEILESKELIELNLPTLSLGFKSYLASSIIRLIKIHLKLLI